MLDQVWHCGRPRSSCHMCGDRLVDPDTLYFSPEANGWRTCGSFEDFCATEDCAEQIGCSTVQNFFRETDCCADAAWSPANGEECLCEICEAAHPEVGLACSGV